MTTALGDIDRPVFPRSACTVLQALRRVATAAGMLARPHAPAPEAVAAGPAPGG